MGYGMRVLDIREHGTGYIEVVVCAVEVNGNVTREGPPKVYGTDTDRLKYGHGGDVMNWLLSVKQEHQAHAGLHDSALAQLSGLKGKVL